MQLPRRSFGDQIERLGPVSRRFLVVALFALGVTLDFASGPEYRMLFLDVATVMLAAWYVSTRFAAIMALAFAISGFWLTLPVTGEPPALPGALWNPLMKWMSLMLILWLTGQKRAAFDGLRKEADRDALALHAEESFTGSLQHEIEVREAEQRRIGRDLHDGLSQRLTATMLASKVLEERLAEHSPKESASARQITVLVSEALQGVRDLTRGLYPADLVAGGLPTALERLAATTERATRIPCEFMTTDEELELDDAVATHLFRIAQEALSNCVRHAEPGRISIELIAKGAGLELRITDDGIGIPESALAEGGLGLRTMRERARSIGGAIELSSPTEGGTRIVCAVATLSRGDIRSGQEPSVNPATRVRIPSTGRI